MNDKLTEHFNKIYTNGGAYYFDAFRHINKYEITRDCPKCKFYFSKPSGGVVAPCKGLPCYKYEEKWRR